MAILRQYEFVQPLDRIFEDMQKSVFGEQTYYAELKFENWEGIEEIASRYGLIGKYSKPLEVDDSEFSCEVREQMLYDEDLSPFIECVREKVLPAAKPGHMYNINGVAKSFSEVNWHERFEQEMTHCKDCMHAWYSDTSFFPLVLEEDDGTQSLHWASCSDIWNLSDDCGEVSSWNENGTPCGRIGTCSNFEWS